MSPASPRSEPMTVEEGRAVLRRVRVLGVVARAGLVVAFVAIVAFAASLIDLTRIESDRFAGLPVHVPYWSYAAMAAFWGSMALVVVARIAASSGLRALASEQARRDAEVVEAEIAVADAALAAAPADDTGAAGTPGPGDGAVSG